MTTVVAAIDNSGAAAPVVATANRIAELYDATARALHVREDGIATARAAAERAGLELEIVEGRPIDALGEAERDPDVQAVVVGSRATSGGPRPAGSTAIEFVGSVSTPVILVPPDIENPGRIESILVPLDGTSASAAALAETISLARRSGVEVVVLHVHEEERLPPFSEHLQHEARAWAEEFVARNCPCPLEEVKLEQRVGVPHEHLVQVVNDTGVDLVAIGWSQELVPGRAAVVREALSRCPVPVLLIPVDSGP